MIISKKNILLAILGVVAVLVVVAVFLLSGLSEKDVDYDKLPVARMSASYPVDMYNPEEVVGLADYVFVAKVIKMVGTEYEGESPIEKENGGVRYASIPFTKYQVQVIDNIKGELLLDEVIELSKMGGVDQDETAIFVLYDDFLPEVGKTYIFTTTVDKDGTLIVSGANSNIAFDEKESQLKTEKAIEKTTEYKKYLAAFENEVENNDIERYKYEEG